MPSTTHYIRIRRRSRKGGNVTWQATLEPVDSDQSSETRTFDTKAEAREWAHRRRAAAMRTHVTTDGTTGTTVDDLVSHFLDHPSLANATRELTLYVWRAALHPLFGSLSADELTPRVINAGWSKLENEGSWLTSEHDHLRWLKNEDALVTIRSEQAAQNHAKYLDDVASRIGISSEATYRTWLEWWLTSGWPNDKPLAVVADRLGVSPAIVQAARLRSQVRKARSYEQALTYLGAPEVIPDRLLSEGTAAFGSNGQPVDRFRRQLALDIACLWPKKVDFESMRTAGPAKSVAESAARVGWAIVDLGWTADSKVEELDGRNLTGSEKTAITSRLGGRGDLSVARARRTLSAVLSAATSDGLIGHNPMAGMRKRTERGQTATKRPKMADQESLAAVMAHAATPPDTESAWVALFVRVLASTGARRGEALALRVDQIRAGEQIRIEESVGRDGKLKATKTEGSVRWVTIDPKTRELCLCRAEHYGLRGKQPLFTNVDTGEVFKPASASTALRKLCKRLGLEPFTPHMVRHTVASHVVAAAGLVEAAQMLGHSAPTTTLKVYSHAVTPDDKSHHEHLPWL